jgi:hypothetical protein
MFPGYYHNPPRPVSTRVRCPVCQKEVYSRAGIHPQCAVKQSESQSPTTPAVAVTDSDGGQRSVAEPTRAVVAPDVGKLAVSGASVERAQRLTVCLEDQTSTTPTSMSPTNVSGA